MGSRLLSGVFFHIFLTVLLILRWAVALAYRCIEVDLLDAFPFLAFLFLGYCSTTILHQNMSLFGD